MGPSRQRGAHVPILNATAAAETSRVLDATVERNRRARRRLSGEPSTLRGSGGSRDAEILRKKGGETTMLETATRTASPDATTLALQTTELFQMETFRPALKANTGNELCACICVCACV